MKLPNFIKLYEQQIENEIIKFSVNDPEIFEELFKIREIFLKLILDIDFIFCTPIDRLQKETKINLHGDSLIKDLFYSISFNKNISVQIIL